MTPIVAAADASRFTCFLSRRRRVVAVFALCLAGPAVRAADVGGANDALEEVVVTAQKRSETILSVPISITALGATALEQRGIRDLNDIARATPSLSITSDNGFGYANVSIRGISSATGAATTGMYVDDTPIQQRNDSLALQIGVTRTNVPEAGEQYRWRLGEDPGLTRREVLRAATFSASLELHQERETGSLEPGKLADFIIIDRNVLKVPVEQIAGTRVLATIVGGRTVYEAAQP